MANNYKTVYDVNQYHKQKMETFKKIYEPGTISVLNTQYNYFITYNSYLNEKIRLENNPYYLIYYHKTIAANNKQLESISRILNELDKKKYLSNNLHLIAMYNSYSNMSKEKMKISRRYMLSAYPKIYYSDRKVKSQYKCEYCGNKSLDTIKNGIYHCSVCNHVTTINNENVMIPESNPNSTLKSNSYQRSVYFEQHLNTIRLIKVPKNGIEILQKIKAYANKYNIREFKVDVIRKILKQLPEPRSYPFIPWFYCKLNNKTIPKPISSETIEQMLYLFHLLKTAYNELFGSDKKISLMSYPYITRKILELIEDYDEYLPLILLNNSNENINNCDLRWHKICDKLEWEFWPTYKF